MARFPTAMAEAARAEGLHLRAFDWRAISDREPLTGTAVIGPFGQLEDFLRRFVNEHVSNGVRALLVTPSEETVETVIYFPGYYLDGETEPM